MVDMKDKFPGFKKCMVMMRKRNGQTQEDGFHWLLPHAGDHVHELIEEFKQEKDLGLRCWLLELIGSSKSPAAFDFLAGELSGPYQRLRHWAVWALNNLDTKEARTLLWQARSFTFGSPEETEEFRTDLDAMMSDRQSRKHG
jgi:hypothetical protein